MNGPRQIRLTGRAARLLQMLQDFGHLDGAAYDSALIALADQYGSVDSPALVDVAHVRAIAAALLLDHPQVDDGPLGEDWGPLFH